MAYNLYWGDLHSHCDASYGHGTAAQALARARQQLDFCSVTGHAFWPDMPTDRQKYAHIIDYHRAGFERLAGNWPAFVQQHHEACEPGKFIALPSYEWHSLKYGDHNIYGRDRQLPLRDACDLPALRAHADESDALLIPHHIAYAAGYRGIDWDHFQEDRSPFVEVFSLHGCSVSPHSPYPMLHVMGPRDAAGTAEAGWQRGLHFGIVAGTDHHGAYPGSHGDGRMGVFAESLTREALWQAWQARRVFAATGDRIDARLFVDDAPMGSRIDRRGERRIRVAVRGSDAIRMVELYRNRRVLRRFFPDQPQAPPAGPYRLRITWGWGDIQQLVRWDMHMSLSAGTIRHVETCFRGNAIVAPRDDKSRGPTPDDCDLPHAVVERDDNACTWRSQTMGNTTVRHDATQSISFELDAPLSATVRLQANGSRLEHTLEALTGGGRSHYLSGLGREAVVIGPAASASECTVEAQLSDTPENEVDYYRLEVAQHNGQWAWTSPIWVQR